MSSYLGFRGAKPQGEMSAAQKAQQKAMAAMRGEVQMTNPTMIMQQRMKEQREMEAINQARMAEAMLQQAQMAMNGIPTPQSLIAQKKMQREQDSLRGAPSIKNLPASKIMSLGTKLNQGEKRPPTKAQQAFMQQQQHQQFQQQQQQQGVMSKSDFNGFQPSRNNGIATAESQQRQAMLQMMQQQQLQSQQSSQSQQVQPSQGNNSLLRNQSAPSNSTLDRLRNSGKVQQVEERIPDVIETQEDVDIDQKYQEFESRIAELENINQELMEKVILLLDSRDAGTLNAPGNNPQYDQKIEALQNAVQGLTQLVQQKTVDGAERELFKKIAQFDSQIKIKFNDMEKRDMSSNVQIQSVISDMRELRREVEDKNAKIDEMMETVHKETNLAWGKTAYDTCMYPEIPTYDNNVDADAAVEAGTVMMLVYPPVDNGQTGKWIQTRMIEGNEIVSKWIPFCATKRWIEFDTEKDDKKDIEVFVDLTLVPHPQDPIPDAVETQVLYDNAQDE